MQKIYIREGDIRLGQFLKLANAVGDGIEAKIRIQEGEVLVNGEVETRRGKKLTQGDVVEIDGTRFQVSCRAAE